MAGGMHDDNNDNMVPLDLIDEAVFCLIANMIFK